MRIAWFLAPLHGVDCGACASAAVPASAAWLQVAGKSELEACMMMCFFFPLLLLLPQVAGVSVVKAQVKLQLRTQLSC